MRSNRRLVPMIPRRVQSPRSKVQRPSTPFSRAARRANSSAASERSNASTSEAPATAPATAQAAAAKAGAEQVHETGLRVTSGGGASINRCAELAVWLAGINADGLSGRMISAFTDDFESLGPKISDIMASDLYTIRRVGPP